MASPFNYGYLKVLGGAFDEHDWHWEDGWELLYPTSWHIAQVRGFLFHLLQDIFCLYLQKLFSKSNMKFITINRITSILNYSGQFRLGTDF